jgi:hypothetical protein
MSVANDAFLFVRVGRNERRVQTVAKRQHVHEVTVRADYQSVAPFTETALTGAYS